MLGRVWFGEQGSERNMFRSVYKLAPELQIVTVWLLPVFSEQQTEFHPEKGKYSRWLGPRAARRRIK